MRSVLHGFEVILLVVPICLRTIRFEQINSCMIDDGRTNRSEAFAVCKVTGVATLPTEVHSSPPAWPIRDDIRYLLSDWVEFHHIH